MHLQSIYNFWEVNTYSRLHGDKVTNKIVLQKAKLTSVTALIKPKWLCRLGHVRQMEDGCIPKDP
jgi:hypothetical protein